MAAADDSEPPSVAPTKVFFRRIGVFDELPEWTQRRGFYSELVRRLLRADRVDRGRISCSFTVKPAFVNTYNTLHGGVVAAVAETVAVACVKTVAGDKNFFLGETSTAYLSAATLDAEMEVEGRVVRHGRNVIVTSVDLRIKETGKVFYTYRATFYVLPAANL